MIQDILRLDIPMSQPFSLQFFQNRQYLCDESVDLFLSKLFIFLPPKANILVQIHLILLHKQQKLSIFFRFFLTLTFQTLLPFIPSDIGSKQAQPQKRCDVVMFDLIYLFEQLNQMIAVSLFLSICDCIFQPCICSDLTTGRSQILKEHRSKKDAKVRKSLPPQIDYILQKQLNMKVLAITHKDTDWLYQIKSTLVQKWVSSKQNPQKLSNNFDDAINGKCDDFAYAILVKDQDQIMLIASLFKEYKLTRGLCETYHLQIEYKNCTTQEELYFQREIVKLLPVYKVTGLAVTESPTFHPHQVLMDIRLIDQTLKGNL